MWDAGRYAAYVWLAYGLSALVLSAVVIETLLRARRWRRAAQPRDVAVMQDAARKRP